MNYQSEVNWKKCQRMESVELKFNYAMYKFEEASKTHQQQPLQ